MLGKAPSGVLTDTQSDALEIEHTTLKNDTLEQVWVDLESSTC